MSATASPSEHISELDLHLFGEGNHHHIYEKLGAHPTSIDGVHGTRFAVWAPNAKRVSVVGDFNHWDGGRNVMQLHGLSGIWEVFVPGVAPGALYKFELATANGHLLMKADPYAFQMQLRPQSASVVAKIDAHEWHDHDWMARRRT